MEPQNGKALARRGHAKAAQKDFTGAVADLQRACRLFPNDETLAQTLEDARQQLRESGQAEVRSFSSVRSLPLSSPLLPKSTLLQKRIPRSRLSTDRHPLCTLLTILP